MATNIRTLWLTNSAMIMEPYCASFPQKDQLTVFRYDKDEYVDKNINFAVDYYKPDVTIYTGHAEGPSKPNIQTLKDLRKKSKTAFEASDASCPGFRRTIEQYQENDTFDLVFNVDGNDNWPKREKDFTTVALVAPQYYEKTLPKDIRLGFAGGDGSLFRRQLIVPLEVHCGLKTHRRNEAWGSYQDCADFFMRCKMTVNFPQTASGLTYHLKARVLEAGLGKCCLFEARNPITPKWFQPGSEYIEYDDIHDLMEKINGISDEEIEMKATRLHLAVKEKYMPINTWRRVFNALGFTLE